MKTDQTNVVTEETESVQYSREEILAVSREENKNGDERERQYYGKANSLAFSVGLLIAGIVLLVEVNLDRRFPAEILLLTCAMQAVQSFVVAFGNRKFRKLYLTVGIVEAVLSVVFLVLWILQLCGIW